MITRDELKVLLKQACKPNASFSFAEQNQAVVNGLNEYYKIDGIIGYREAKASGILNMALIDEVLTEVIPEAVRDIMGSYAEVISFGRDEEVKFTMKGVGKARARLGIKQGARNGIYEARTLDDKNFFLPVKTFTAGALVSLEDILLGRVTIVDLMNNILDGILYKTYIEVVDCLRAAASAVPSANKATAAGWVAASVDPIIRVVNAYGKANIVCFHSLAVKITNALGSTTPNISASDVDDVRQKGFITIYKGTPVIEIPNFILDEATNATWAFNENMAFILPAGEKPVKIAMKGEGYTQTNQLPTGGEEQMYHQMMGVGILVYNNIGLYTDSAIN